MINACVVGIHCVVRGKFVIHVEYVFSHGLHTSTHGCGMCMYGCIYGYVYAYLGCGMCFQKRESQPSRAIFIGTQLEILIWPGHWAFITSSMFKEE